MDNLSDIYDNWLKSNTEEKVEEGTVTSENTSTLSKVETGKDAVAARDISDETSFRTIEITNKSVSETRQGVTSSKNFAAPKGKEKQKTFNKQLEKIIFTYVTVFVDKWFFSGILVGVFKDFLVLVNGCRITEIRLREINAVEFKAWGCPEQHNKKMSSKQTASAQYRPQISARILRNIFNR